MYTFTLTSAQVTGPLPLQTLGGNNGTDHGSMHILENAEIQALGQFFSPVPNAVNFPTLSGAAASGGITGSTTIAATGSDPNINLSLFGKGTGGISVNSSSPPSGVKLYCAASLSTDIPFKIDGAAGQTGDLFQAGGNGIAPTKIDSKGHIAVGLTYQASSYAVFTGRISGGSPQIALTDDFANFQIGMSSPTPGYNYFLSYGNTGLKFNVGASGTTRLFLSDAGSMIFGTGSALATSATDGFLHIPNGPGAPTGVPTLQTGSSPIYHDTLNNKFWIYNSSGGWKGVTLT